jgi:hypothetical protein
VNITFFLDLTLYSPVEVYQHFGGTYILPSSSQSKRSHVSSQQEAGGKQKKLCMGNQIQIWACKGEDIMFL